MTSTATTADRARPAIPSAHRFLLPGLIFGCLVVAVNSSLGAPLIPQISTTEHVLLATAQWSLTITMLVGTVATPILGRLGDGRLRRPVMLTSLFLSLLGGVLAALPLGFGALLVGRGLQGLGLVLTPLAIATVRDVLPSGKARPAVAALSITTVSGVGLGYPLTGLIDQAGGLHVAYWFGVGVTLCAAVCALAVLPSSSHRPSVRLDVPGSFGLVIALVCLLLAVSEGDQWGWTSTTVIVLVIVGVAAAAAWSVVELRSSHPLVDLRLLRIRTVLTADGTAVLAGVGMYLLLVMVPRLVQTPTSTGYGFGDSVVVAGLALVPFSAFSYLATRMTPVVTRVIPIRAVLPVSSLIGMASMAFFTFAHSSIWEVVIAMAGTGIGVGGIFAVIPGFVLSAVPSSETGSAMSFNQVLRYVGYSFGSAMGGVILEGHTRAGSEYPTDSGYVVVGLVGCALWVLAAVASAVLPGRGARTVHADDDPALGRLSDEALLADESAASAVPDDADAHPVRP